ncbi:MAG TPA: hypothetical protein VE973_03335 [Candidatus Limnocylindria bacterium]|nr:hypothetical protein [Candidatus Limnocylindria bacterium]
MNFQTTVAPGTVLVLQNSLGQRINSLEVTDCKTLGGLIPDLVDWDPEDGSQRNFRIVQKASSFGVEIVIEQLD